MHDLAAMSGPFHFDRYLLDPEDRRLSRAGQPVELSGRYLDALVLLVREAGKLVTKDRLLEEVWRGVPVTDEALTQCIRTLRRQLGDSAAAPRFIETVPKHGYRFIAAVQEAGEGRVSEPPATEVSGPRVAWENVLLLGGAGMVGSGLGGILVGLFYGFAAAVQPLEPGMGAISVLLVLVCLTILLGLAAGAGVGLGIAVAHLAAPRSLPWSVVGGAAGGLLVGATVKLVGLDAFNLLLGQSPGDITGASEGALLGAAAGFAYSLDRGSVRRTIGLAAASGGVAGLLIAAAGGRLMGGSLDLLARQFPGSRLQLGRIGGLFGETDYGALSRLVTSGLEGALFGAFTIGAMVIARRNLAADGRRRQAAMS
ncbi:transcriptional regulator [uncultured Sphingomonas sp.]|uniref:winged helix-turn-helix domain-containing protein n=1 Tax=uncultured Sphingomonas sp. TaxID=158754 RepID=UPI0025CCA3C0|nr:transcriptional regulator [uncultured Sphingomonas sp.]